VDKLLFGVLWFAVIMLVLVLPMMMFSSLNPGLAENRVTACTAQVCMPCPLPPIPGPPIMHACTSA
jgi:hypothetical protein